MAPPHTTAWSVYEEQLGSLGWGTPLWYPEPESEGGIQIGDVGYLRRGGFKPFFNAIHSRPLTLTTLPSDFIPLKYNTDLLNVERDNYIDPQPITSKTVTLVNVGANAGAGMYVTLSYLSLLNLMYFQGISRRRGRLQDLLFEAARRNVTPQRLGIPTLCRHLHQVR